LNNVIASLAMSFMMSNIPADQQECLALNVYHESRDQSTLGQMAVALVTINRVEDSRYPSDICSVVKQRGFYDPPDAPIVIGRCQFHFFCDGKSDEPTDTVAYDVAMQNAAHAYYMHHIGYDITEGSTHYHTVDVYPNWANNKVKIVTIDDHIFYRWD